MIRRADPLLLVLLCGSLAGNVYQFRNGGSRPPLPTALRAGTVVPPLTGAKLDGTPFRLDFSKNPVVLYAFSPTCGWCDRNLDNALALSGGIARQHEYEFVAVALNAVGIEKYLAKSPLPWTIVRDVPEEVRKAYQLGGTPQTIVISKGGRVQNVWTGAYAPDVQAAIERVFGIKLPGLRDAASKS